MHKNKTAIVSGGAGGIGLAVVKRLLADGAQVVFGDADEQKGRAACKECADEGHAGRVRFLPGDVTDAADVERLVGAAVEGFGSLDISVACAAVIHSADFLDVTVQDFRRVMDINVTGTLLLGQAAAKAMVRLGAGGAIVNFSSVISKLVSSDQAAYAASKGAVQQLTRVMALSLVDHGIRVNAVAPGITDTPMMRTIMKDEVSRDVLLSRTPMRRPARPEEIAAVVAFLASEEASYVTGQTIFADGGRLALNYTVPPKS